MSNPVWVCVLHTCWALIGVVGREESLQHTDPPVSCPCAQPVMSKASSSRAPAYHCGHYLYPAPLCPGLWCPLKELHAHLPRGLSCLESNPLLPASCNQDFGCVPASPAQSVLFQRTRPNSFGVALWLSRSLIFMVFQVLCIASCHAKVFCWGTCMLTVRWSLREREKSIGLEGLNLKVVKLLCKLQSAIQWKLLLL